MVSGVALLLISGMEALDSPEPIPLSVWGMAVGLLLVVAALLLASSHLAAKHRAVEARAALEAKATAALQAELQAVLEDLQQERRTVASERGRVTKISRRLERAEQELHSGAVVVATLSLVLRSMKESRARLIQERNGAVDKTEKLQEFSEQLLEKSIQDAEQRKSRTMIRLAASFIPHGSMFDALVGGFDLAVLLEGFGELGVVLQEIVDSGELPELLQETFEDISGVVQAVDSKATELVAELQLDHGVDPVKVPGRVVEYFKDFAKLEEDLQAKRLLGTLVASLPEQFHPLEVAWLRVGCRSVREFAERAELHPSTVRRILAGRVQSPHTETLGKLSKVLEIDLEVARERFFPQPESPV